jgi:hypothetical protein
MDACFWELLLHIKGLAGKFAPPTGRAGRQYMGISLAAKGDPGPGLSAIEGRHGPRSTSGVVCVDLHHCAPDERRHERVQDMETASSQSQHRGNGEYRARQISGRARAPSLARRSPRLR